MKKHLHAGHAFFSFCNAVSILAQKNQEKMPEIGNYSKEIIHARFIQRLVTLALFPYIKKAYKEVELSGDLSDTGKLGLTEVVLDTPMGIRFTVYQFLRSTAEYGYEWTMILKSLFSRLRDSKKDKITSPTTLVFGIGGESIKFEGKDDRFVKYCKEGPILPLKEAEIRLIQSTFTDLNKSQEFLYVEKPFHGLLERAEFSFVEYWTCFFSHLLNPFYYLFITLKSPIIVILGRDVAYMAAAKALTKKKLIKDIVLTNTNYTDQFLWMRNSKNYGFKVHYINYSQNNRPLGYAGDNFIAHHPNISHIFADVQWVWTYGYSDYLRSIGFKGEINIVGPIMFYLPEGESLARREDVFRIALFDVTPIYDHVAANIGIINNYYNGSTLNRFLTSIIEVCESLSIELGIKIEIVLKHKRHFNKNHDLSYVELCNKMSAEKKISIIDYDTNIFNFISSADLTISIPYTSSAYVATFLEVPSIYFDGDNLLNKNYEKHPLLTMCLGEEELRDGLRALLLRRSK